MRDVQEDYKQYMRGYDEGYNEGYNEAIRKLKDDKIGIFEPIEPIEWSKVEKGEILTDEDMDGLEELETVPFDTLTIENFAKILMSLNISKTIIKEIILTSECNEFSDNMSKLLDYIRDSIDGIEEMQKSSCIEEMHNFLECNGLE